MSPGVRRRANRGATRDDTTPDKQPYHHGDLHTALVRTGLALLATRSVDDVSLREIARTVGVSANAVYRHFPDKGALMKALAREGLRRLAEAQRAVAMRSAGRREGFAATGRAYVVFAVENPALFRLIFSSPRHGGVGGGADAEADSMAFLRANAAAVAGPGEDERVVALRAWSLAHGLAMLILDGQVNPDETLIETVFATPLSA